MGKRYGRNQKRKHREIIAEMQERIVSEQSLISYHSKERAKYQSMFEELVGEIRKWWNNSVLIEPKITQMDRLPPMYRTIEQKPLRFGDFSKTTPMTEVEIFHQTLDALEIAVGEDFATMATHVMVSCGSGNTFKYYIDTKAFDQLEGLPQYSAKYIYREIERAFAEKYRGKHG